VSLEGLDRAGDHARALPRGDERPVRRGGLERQVVEARRVSLAAASRSPEAEAMPPVILPPV